MNVELLERRAESRICKYKVFGDKRGCLISLESNKNIPFDIKRIYYIFGSDYYATRGKHAHKNLEQVLVCVKGSCVVKLDNGESVHQVHLDSPDIGLHIKGLIWREMHSFSPDCVLMVLANNLYDPDDYIHDYEEFCRLAKAQKA